MIRGKTISYSTHLKRENQRLEQELENNLKTLHEQLETNPTSVDLRDSINNAEDQLKIFRERKINGIMARAKAQWQAEGEKCNRSLLTC